MLKLYYTKGACSLAARIVINEIGLECEYVSVDLREKKTETGEDYLKINVKGAVPALMTKEGEILTENSVIEQYLADSSHATHLLPSVGEFKRYRVLEWLNYTATDMHKNFGMLFNPYLDQNTKDQIVIPLLKTKLKCIDKNLQHNQYLSGDAFTLPDSYMFVMLTWAMYFKFDLNEWQNISRYYNELKNRKSVVKSLKEEEASH